VLGAVHGADIAEVAGSGVVPGVDGLVTDTPELALVALAADCVPMAVIGDDGRTVAAVHCGWRGLALDVVGALLNVLDRRGCGVQQAVLGPAVCGGCYPVPEDRAAQVAAACGDAVAAAALVTCADGQAGIDVRVGITARLLERGVPAAAIRTVGGCTVEDPGLFSYRRDGVTGRQGILVARMAV
jgi:YfiH family protein